MASGLQRQVKRIRTLANTGRLPVQRLALGLAFDQHRITFAGE